MKSLLSTIIFLIFLSIACIGQETKRFFLDENLDVTDSINATYTMDVNVVNNRYHIANRNMNKEIVHYGEYISINPWVEDGLTRNYSEPGQLYSTGYFRYGRLVGEWLYYNADQTVDTVNYDLCDIEIADENCYKRNRQPTYRRIERAEIQRITGALSVLINENFHLPARTRNNTRAFNAYIRFLLADNGEIPCLSITGVRDDDLIAEIHRIICLFKYEKESKKDLQIEFEMKYNELENTVYYSPELWPDEQSEGEDQIYVLVEDHPHLVTDEYNSFLDYVNKNIILPSVALDYSVKGSVVVHFVVEKDGSLSNIRIVQGIHPDLDNEALRLIEVSPKWQPGRQLGKPERVRVVFDIPFYPE